MKIVLFRGFLILVLSLLLNACGLGNYQKFVSFSEAYQNVDYCKASDVVLDESDICNTQMEAEDAEDYDIDEQLNGGASLFLAKKYENSSLLLESAANKIQEELNSSGVLKGTVEIVANASALDYTPMVMDSIYMYSYSFYNALALEDKEEAKLQINRAYEVQKNATEYFAKEIEKLKQEAEESAAKISEEAKIANDASIAAVLSNYKEFSRWQGYTNFVNPYVTYLSGLYFMVNSTGKSDIETASNYLKRVSGMLPNNEYVKDDLKLAEQLANGKIKKIEPTAWVVFENGMVTHLKEFRLDLPIFIATNNVKTATIAIPYPSEREMAYTSILVSNGKKKYQTQLLADVDSIFISEFNKKLPTLITKAVSKLVFQTTLQAVAQNEFGDLGGIIASAYSVVTAGADTRSWYGLPKNVQLVKVKKNKSGKLTLYIGEQELDIDVPSDGHSLVYVRIPYAGTTPFVNVFNL